MTIRWRHPHQSNDIATRNSFTGQEPSTLSMCHQDKFFFPRWEETIYKLYSTVLLKSKLPVAWKYIIIKYAYKYIYKHLLIFVIDHHFTPANWWFADQSHHKVVITICFSGAGFWWELKQRQQWMYIPFHGVYNTNTER